MYKDSPTKSDNSFAKMINIAVCDDGPA